MFAVRGVREEAQSGAARGAQGRPLLPRALLRGAVRAATVRTRDQGRIAQELRPAERLPQVWQRTQLAEVTPGVEVEGEPVHSNDRKCFFPAFWAQKGILSTNIILDVFLFLFRLSAISILFRSCHNVFYSNGFPHILLGDILRFLLCPTQQAPTFPLSPANIYFPLPNFHILLFQLNSDFSSFL